MTTATLLADAGARFEHILGGQKLKEVGIDPRTMRMPDAGCRVSRFRDFGPHRRPHKSPKPHADRLPSSAPRRVGRGAAVRGVWASMR